MSLWCDIKLQQDLRAQHEFIKRAAVKAEMVENKGSCHVCKVRKATASSSLCRDLMFAWCSSSSRHHDLFTKSVPICASSLFCFHFPLINNFSSSSKHDEEENWKIFQVTLHQFWYFKKLVIVDLAIGATVMWCSIFLPTSNIHDWIHKSVSEWTFLRKF